MISFFLQEDRNGSISLFFCPHRVHTQHLSPVFFWSLLFVPNSFLCETLRFWMFGTLYFRWFCVCSYNRFCCYCNLIHLLLACLVNHADFPSIISSTNYYHSIKLVYVQFILFICKVSLLSIAVARFSLVGEGSMGFGNGFWSGNRQ